MYCPFSFFICFFYERGGRLGTINFFLGGSGDNLRFTYSLPLIFMYCKLCGHSLKPFSLISPSNLKNIKQQINKKKGYLYLKYTNKKRFLSFSLFNLIIVLNLKNTKKIFSLRFYQP